MPVPAHSDVHFARAVRPDDCSARADFGLGDSSRADLLQGDSPAADSDQDDLPRPAAAARRVDQTVDWLADVRFARVARLADYSAPAGYRARWDARSRVDCFPDDCSPGDCSLDDCSPADCSLADCPDGYRVDWRTVHCRAGSLYPDVRSQLDYSLQGYWLQDCCSPDYSADFQAHSPGARPVWLPQSRAGLRVPA